MRPLAALLAVVFTCAGASAAGSAQGKRQAAKAALLAGDADAALTLVDEGLAIDPRDKDLLLLRGHVLLKLSDYPAALEAYRTYLAAGATGGNRRAVERIVANLGNITKTFLRVVVKNGPANVFVDARSGRPFCVAAPDCEKGVVPGDHLIIVERPGFGRATERVSIEANSTVTVEKTLVERPSPLSLRIEPSDAAATLDGGPLAGVKEVAPGAHVVEVKKPGYLPVRREVVAAGGEKIEVAVSLRRGVPVELSPPDATVEIDGVAAEVAGGLVALPPGPGPHQARARAPAHREATATIPAGPPLDFRLSLALVPLGAQLVVAGAPAGAALFVDGARRGTVPLAEPLEVPPGKHAVEVVAPGYLPFRTSADLPAGRTATVRIDDLRQPSHARAWVAFGVAGASVAAGTVFGLLALSKSSDFDARAAQAGVTRSDMELGAIKDDGKRFSVLSDVSFGVGIVAVAAGFFFWRADGNATSGGGIDVGPGGVAVSGRF